MYYHSFASYCDSMETAKAFQIWITFKDGSCINSSSVPYSQETLSEVNLDIATFLADEGPFAIWEKDTKVLSYVHLCDVRKISIKFIS